SEYDGEMRRAAAVLLVVLGACSAEAPGGVASTLDDAPVVTAREAPPGSDARPALDVVWRGARFDAARAVLRVPDALFVTDATGVLWRVDARGARGHVADGVAVPPIASDDGAAIAFVEEGGVLVVREGGVSQILAQGLPSCGLLRFSPDRRVLAFAGVSP